MRRPESSFVFDVLFLVVVWLALFVRHSELEEFHREEGRRALPAREMVEQGQYVVPTVFHEPYLTKPPMMFWAVAASSAFSDPIEPFTARIPSLAATLLLALLLYAFAYRFRGKLTARCAALLFLITPMVFEKGTLGEIEALLALFVFSSVASAWVGIARVGIGRSRVWIVLSGMLLGCAVLTKGPVALVFHAGALLGYAALVRRRDVILPTLATVGLSFVVAVPWVWMLVERLEWAEVRRIWMSESVGGGSGASLSVYVKERWKFALGAFFGFLPSSLLWLTALFGRDRKQVFREDVVRFAACGALAGVVFFLLFPYSRARYAFPAVPWFAFIGGELLARAILSQRASEIMEKASVHGPKLAVRAFAGIGALLAVVIAVAAVLELAGADVIPIETTVTGWILLTAVASCGALAALNARRNLIVRAVAFTFLTFALGRVFHLESVVPLNLGRHGVNERASALASHLNTEEVPYTTHYGSFNVFARLDRFLQLTADPWTSVQAGERLVTTPADVERYELDDGSAWKAIAEISFDDEQPLLLLERASATDESR